MERVIKRIEWLQEWDRHTLHAKDGYVEGELDKLAQKGEPLLYAALTLPLSDQIDAAIRALRKRQPYVFLRLVDPIDAKDGRPHGVPPPLDPQGRELAEEDKDRVLVAKVGVRGQMDKSELEHADRVGSTRHFTGSARHAMEGTSQGLYRVMRITRTPMPVPLDDAIVIMRQWGEGIRLHQFRKGSTKKYREDGSAYNIDTMQDTWLVIEVPSRDGQMLTPPQSTDRAQKQGQRAA